MTTQSEYLEHIGLVIDTKGGHLKIALIGSGCSGCHNSLCMLGSSKAKEIDLVSNENSLHVGDEVLVKVNPTSGYKAVMLLYIFPFVLMMLALFFVANAGYSEGMAGLVSLFVLLPYFFIIYLFKKSLAGQCNFEVMKR